MTSNDETKRGPLAWMARNKVAANILMVLFLVGGLIMAYSIKQEVFPSFDFDIITVTVVYPGTSPQEVEEGIVLSVEEAVRDITGVKEITSTASEGVASIRIEFVSGVNRARILSDVKNAVDGLTSLPEDAERPTVNLLARRSLVLDLVIFGDVDEFALKDLSEMARDELLAKPEITYVEISGLRPLEISVEIPGAELRKYNLTLSQVANIIRAYSRDVSAGGVKTEKGEILLRVQERKDVGKEFLAIPIVSRPDGSYVTLGEIAKINDGFADTDQAAYFNGKPAVMVQVSREGEQTPLEVSAATKDYVKELKARLPEGVDVTTQHDRAEIYRERMDLLMRNAYLGLILVIVLLGFFLEIKLAFWVTMGIPISFLGSFLFLPALDVSINMISLMAFIVALGIVVDDAIVVGENIFTNRRKGMSHLKAAVTGVREMSVPVTFAIITNVVAFFPLLYIEGIMGKIARQVPLVVITAFIISLVEALFILPAHLAHSNNKKGKGLSGIIHRRQAAISGFIEKLINNIYGPFLRFAIRNRYATVAAALAMLVATGGFLAGGHIAFTFSPATESDDVEATIELAYGAPVEETIAVQDRVVAAAWRAIEKLGERDDCEGIFTNVGSSSGMRHGPFGGGGGSASHAANVRIYFVTSDLRDFEVSDFVKLWRKETGEIPGLEKLAFSVREIGPPGGSAINVELRLRDSELLEQAALELAAALQDFPNVKDIDDGVAPGKAQMDFKVKPEGSAMGLTSAEIGRQIRSSFYGAEALRLQRGRDEIKVMVRLPENERESEATVEDFLVRTPAGGELPLEKAASVKHDFAYKQITRIDGYRVISVTADVVPRSEAGKIYNQLKDGSLQKLATRYPGLSYKIGGREKERQDSMKSILKGFAFALIVIFGLLAVVFKSYAQPVIIMTAIPFGIIGSVAGHVLLGYNMSLLSFMGLVALSGVVVNDSLILVDLANRNRRAGMKLFEGVTDAGISRFRPIVLTTMTTFFGLMPMILETSPFVKMLIPMAISLGFGVLFSTAILLLLVPSLYLIVEDLRGILFDPKEEFED